MSVLNWLRLLLFPFAILYGIVVAIRSWLFTFGFKEVYQIPGKSICVGNLSTGGTGKSPHVLYLYDLLFDQHEVVILSRGYGRKTEGYREVKLEDTPETVGDEPLMFKTLRPDAKVVVCENRKFGVEKIRNEVGFHAVILLDDAFQHRWVKAGLQIIITEFQRPFYTDFLLPAGNLREWRRAYKRADLVVMSKCPDGLIDEDRIALQSVVKHRPLYFSQILPQELKPFTAMAKEPRANILAVSGIGNPKPFIRQLKKLGKVESMNFPDHHEFTEADIEKIRVKFGTFANANKMVVITDKDAVKMVSMREKGGLDDLPIFIQPITINIHNEEKFNETIKDYVREV